MSRISVVHWMSLCAVVVLVVALCVNCADENGVAPTGSDRTEDETAEPVIPDAVGTQWQYQTRAPGLGQWDTCTVSVVGELTGPDGVHGREWHIDVRHPDAFWGVDLFSPGQFYVYYSEDSITVLRSDDLENIGLDLRIPLISGDSWTTWTRFHKDQAWVTGIEPVTVPAGDFEEAFHISRFWESHPGGRHEIWDIWIEPGIGIVKLSIDLYCPNCDASSPTYELVSFTPGG